MWRRLATLKSDTVPLRQMPALGFQTAILRPTTSRPAHCPTAALLQLSRQSLITCLKCNRLSMTTLVAITKLLSVKKASSGSPAMAEGAF